MAILSLFVIVCLVSVAPAAWYGGHLGYIFAIKKGRYCNECVLVVPKTEIALSIIKYAILGVLQLPITLVLMCLDFFGEE